jgi:pimeloyl-ACP methyl ester carboxylesterase
MQPNWLETTKGKLAYYCSDGDEKRPGVVFLGGFMSDMNGAKALALEAWCQKNNLRFLRFDYFGHGESEGEFLSATIGIWRENILTMLDNLTSGPQILVGSSLGGWLMVLAALSRPKRVVGLLGVASAPDFTEHLIWQKLSQAEKDTLQRMGRIDLISPYSDAPYPISWSLISEARKHLVLKKNSINFLGPVRLLHGLADYDVPYEYSVRLAEAFTGSDVVIRLEKQGDHRMSTPPMLEVLTAGLAEILNLF